MHTFKTYFFLVLCSTVGYSLQAQSLNWFYKVGGLNADYGTGVTIDSDQNIYDISDFSGSASIGFNLNYTSRGESDILLRKSTNLGIRLWVAQIGGSESDNSYDITVDTDNNIYVTGTFKDTLYYNNTALLNISSFANGVFILKINPSGNVIWSRKFESFGLIQPKTISTIGNTEILITGNFEDTAIFRSTSQPLSMTSNGSTDIFFVKINAVTGEPTFIEQVGGPGQELVNQHIRDNAGSIYLVGEHRTSFDADPSDDTFIMTNKGGVDGFIIKFNSDFDFTWAKHIGNIGNDYVKSVVVDLSRNVIITGGYSNTVDFDPGNTITKTSKGGTDVFLIKYNETGVVQWINSYGGPDNDLGTKVIVNRNEVIYVGGSFSDAVDFNPSPTLKNESISLGGLDIFTCVYNQDGTYNSHFNYGGQANEQLADLALKSNGELISIGGFGAIVDFDPSSSSANIFANGGLDAFMVNYSVCVFPYLKNVFAVKPIVCQSDRAVVIVQEGYLNSATQWSWQRDSCSNITFASGDFIDLPAVRDISYFVRGFGGCVDIVECKRIDIKVFRDSIQYQNLKICQGDTVKVGNSRYWTSGTYVDSLASTSGCDSVIVSEIKVSPKYFQTVNASICMGDTLKVGTAKYTLPGNYTKIFTSINGCDSTIVINLTVKPAIIENVSINLCRGDSIKIKNTVYKQGGTYIQSTKNPNGCDDLLIIAIKLIETKFSRSVTICEGNSITIGTKKYFQSGTYLDSLTSIYNCDSIITTNLTVKPNTSYNQEFDLCFGDSVRVGTKVYKRVGIFRDTLINILGCDSLITTFINSVSPKIVIDQRFQLCQGDSLRVGDIYYHSSGSYKDTLQNQTGCDSIINTNLIILPTNINFNYNLCRGASFEFFDTTYTNVGVYTKKFINSIGCDSIVTLSLTLRPVIATSQNYNYCSGDTIKVAGKIYTKPGVYSDTLNTIFGCDSIINIVIVKLNIEKLLNYDVCFNASVDVNGKTYNKSGVYRDTIVTANRCDSIFTINVNVLKQIIKDTIFNLCRGQNIVVGTSVYSNPGQFTEIVKSNLGCDSTINFEIRSIDFVPIFTVSRDTLKTELIPGAKYQWYQCSQNLQRIIILGAVKPNLAIPKSGLYSLGVTYQGCTYFTDCIFVMLTATDDQSEDAVKVYPNPTIDQLIVDTSIPMDYKVLDLNGQTLLKGKIQPDSNKAISLNSLPSAMYILELTTNQSTKRLRIYKL